MTTERIFAALRADMAALTERVRNLEHETGRQRQSVIDLHRIVLDAPTLPPPPAPEPEYDIHAERLRQQRVIEPEPDEAALREWLTGTIGTYVQSDAETDECVAVVIDGLRPLGLTAPADRAVVPDWVDCITIHYTEDDEWQVAFLTDADSGDTRRADGFGESREAAWQAALRAAPAGADTPGEPRRKVSAGRDMDDKPDGGY